MPFAIHYLRPPLLPTLNPPRLPPLNPPRLPPLKPLLREGVLNEDEDDEREGVLGVENEREELLLMLRLPRLPERVVRVL